MKRDRQSVSLRHAEMLALIRGRQEVMVEELAEHFGVSMMTVRRDLQVLEEGGKVSRFHGGVTSDVRAAAAVERENTAFYRELIARKAASLLAEEDSILINGSNTALSLLNYVDNKSVNVYTNNAKVVERRYSAGVSICLFGGQLRGSGHILLGDLTLKNLMEVYADKCFLGCTGISPDGEILCGIPSELGINETMIDHSHSYYVLADHTKVGKTSAYASFHLEKTGCVITDELAPADVIKRLRVIGMQVIQVKKEDYPDAVQTSRT